MYILRGASLCTCASILQEKSIKAESLCQRVWYPFHYLLVEAGVRPSLFFHVRDIPFLKLTSLTWLPCSVRSFFLPSLLTPCIDVSHIPSVIMIHQLSHTRGCDASPWKDVEQKPQRGKAHRAKSRGNGTGFQGYPVRVSHRMDLNLPAASCDLCEIFSSREAH